MANGIIVFGANGSGKTTLGRELALTLNFKSMDAEDYYFEKTDVPYSKSRAKEEVIKLMLSDIEQFGSFIFSSVIGDYGEKITSMYKLAVFLSVPLDTRMERIKCRAEEKFGKRILSGGDMYEQEQSFYEFVKTRNLSVIDEWADTLTCPMIKLDGRKPIAQSIDFIVEQYKLIHFD